jgi:hypothetical protein
MRVMRPAIMQKLSISILALCLTGGAGITHKPAPYIPVSEANPKQGLGANSKADEKADGVRYYQASPYLLVDSDGKAVEESPAPRRIEPGDRWHSQQNDRQIKNSCPRLASRVFS